MAALKKGLAVVGAVAMLSVMPEGMGIALMSDSAAQEAWASALAGVSESGLPGEDGESGGTAKTGPNDFLRWREATPDAPWAPRTGFTALVFDGKMWVIGGYDPITYERNGMVWYSPDGVEWVEAVSEAPLEDRIYHCSEVFNGKIWVFSGWANATGDDETGDDDVWSSPDGINWTLETASAPWGGPYGRYNARSFVYDDKIWIAGGDDAMSVLDDMWNSPDGVNWTEVPVTWPGGCISSFPSTFLVYSDKLWIKGSFCGKGSGVWNSSDGLVWDLVTPGWASSRATLVFLDRIFLFYSLDYGLILHSDSGTSWSQIEQDYPRHIRDNNSVVFNNRIWVLGGRDSDGYRTDVRYASTVGAGFRTDVTSGELPVPVQFTDGSSWFIEPITSWRWDFGDGEVSEEQNPVHTYLFPGDYTVSLTVASSTGEDTHTLESLIYVYGESHSADTDRNGRIGLSELLRVTQFYNLGALHCATGTEDGYAPLAGDTSCEHHDSDYAPPDWTIGLSEILRLVQFFNAGGYYACPYADPPTEDGFCPGPVKFEG